MPSLPEFAGDMAASGRWIKLTNRSSIQRFQVLGERSSGTNLVHHLVAKHTSLRPTDVLGWKHGFPHMVAVPDDCLVIGVVRALEPWLLSLHRRPWHAHPDLQTLTFSEFIRAPWKTVADGRRHFPYPAKEGFPRQTPLQLDRHPITGTPFENPLALRSAKLASLAGFANRDCAIAFVQMERVVSHPQCFLNWLTQATKAQEVDVPVGLPKRRFGHRFKPTVPERPATPAVLCAADQRWVQDTVDPHWETVFGYMS